MPSSTSRRGRTAFDSFAKTVSDIASGAWFFTASLALVVLWLPTIVVFTDIDTWQLVINTATSVLAFLLIAYPALVSVGRGAWHRSSPFWRRPPRSLPSSSWWPANRASPAASRCWW